MMRIFIVLAWFSFVFMGIAHGKLDYSPPSLENFTMADFRSQNGQLIQNIQIMKKYEQFVRQGVPPMALKRALEVYFHSYGQSLFLKGAQGKPTSVVFGNNRYMGIADYTKSSTEKRFYLLDLKKGTVEMHYVTHGSGSGKTDIASRFSNEEGTGQSSLGLYLTGPTYMSSRFKGRAMKLYGLDPTNDNAFLRYVVIHPASYASEKFLDDRKKDFARTGNQKYKPRLGLSLGCLAFDPAVAQKIIEKLKNGALIYSYIEGAEKMILESPEYQDFKRVPPELDDSPLTWEEIYQQER